MIKEPGKILCALLIAVLSLLYICPAEAVPLHNHFGGPLGYGSECLYHNDDGSSSSISMADIFPQGLRFFSDTHHSMFVNTNGNITFSAALPTFTPDPFPVADQPMIAPYWADVDIRVQNGICDGPFGYSDGSRPCQNPPENGVWWHTEPGKMVITWDRVGYHDCKIDKRMSFQLILTAVEQAHGCIGPGDFDVEFRFNLCEWTTGDASGGADGFGGVPAQSGFDAGDQQNYVEIPGSRTDNIHNIMCNHSNVGEPGIWRYEIRGGLISGCPEAGEPCDTGLLGMCSMGVKQCVADGTECVPLFQPSDEQCSGMDEDCDGIIDNGDDLCGDFQICHRGRCENPCLEFGCFSGQVCSPEGVCVDPECLHISCGQGERCVAGHCVEACQGVVCPPGQVCRLGRCMDICDTISCDDACEVCVDGSCRIKCEWEPCPEAMTCMPDGHCVENACAQVHCDEGYHCAGGICVDSCSGVSCPHGEICRIGECIPGYEDEPGNGSQDPTDPEDPEDPDPGQPDEPDPVDPEDPDLDPVISDGGCDCGKGSAGSGAFLPALLLFFFCLRYLYFQSGRSAYG